MAVFYDTGGGDIYAGPTREAVLEAMKAECDDLDESNIVEVPGTKKICVVDEDGADTGELVTLDEEYEESLGSYCIASDC